ncbi:hypothetical protein [Candidatus Absconditicoccus praedator]|uniref:hypothetical protein n=1 Tax=Candidatus Absconditicoccus praedator TaxID=2735562 RepID=UPI001E3A9FBE|nr:hypothetical protein [Candidatus Absconditicoccus praedator]UFX82728.1 hypothetical protein HLG78_01070 [Candidatus Absconditicoccus praedator]
MVSKLEKGLDNNTLELKDNFCKTMDDLINSNDFKRVFEMVVRKSEYYNIGYFSNILEKIRNNENLERLEKADFLELLENEEIKHIATQITSRLKATNMTMQEVRHFLEDYPADKIINSLKYKAKREVVDILGGKVIEKTHYHSRFSLEEYRMLVDGEYRYCLKKQGEQPREEDFIFFSITMLREVNGQIYYLVTICPKEGYIKLGEEDKFREKIVFDYAGPIEEINGECYYKARIGDKEGYIKLGEEEKCMNNIIFDHVGLLENKNGEYYYHARIGNKNFYIKLGEEEKFDGTNYFLSVFYRTQARWRMLMGRSEIL